MGKKQKAGKRNPEQRLKRKMTDEARQIQQEIEREYVKRMLPIAVQEAFIVLLSVSCITLHDYFSFGKKRMDRFVDHALNTWECVLGDYVSINELSEEVQRMTGCRYALTRDEVETLEKYGLQGLTEEIKLNTAQMEYWADRRAQGWNSDTNRYGKRVI